jgi:fibronectin type III domain protein
MWSSNRRPPTSECPCGLFQHPALRGAAAAVFLPGLYDGVWLSPAAVALACIHLRSSGDLPMTHPNLLRLSRSCAKWRSGSLLVATLFLIGPSVQDLPPLGLAAFPSNAGAVSEQRVGRNGDGTGGGPSESAPAGVTDLKAFAVSDSAVVLTWTEVASGTSAIPRYLVRYDSLGAFQWSSAPDVLTGNCGAPIVATRATGGRLRACLLTGLAPGVAYQVQMVAYTGTLNTTAVFGPLSNIVDVTTMQRVGPMLVWRTGMYRDTIPDVTEIVTPWGDWAITVHLRFGEYRGFLRSDSGVIRANAYLLLVHP